MNRKKMAGVCLVFVSLVMLFFVVLISCLYFQEELICGIIYLWFCIWMIKNIYKFVIWITEVN